MECPLYSPNFHRKFFSRNILMECFFNQASSRGVSIVLSKHRNILPIAARDP